LSFSGGSISDGFATSVESVSTAKENAAPRARFLALATALLLSLTLTSAVVGAEIHNTDHVTLYFLNGIVVYRSSTNETLVLETPANLTPGRASSRRS
jgi:hypothetical protein